MSFKKITGWMKVQTNHIRMAVNYRDVKNPNFIFQISFTLLGYRSNFCFLPYSTVCHLSAVWSSDSKCSNIYHWRTNAWNVRHILSKYVKWENLLGFFTIQTWNSQQPTSHISSHNEILCIMELRIMDKRYEKWFKL